jgi:hypothetical protein
MTWAEVVNNIIMGQSPIATLVIILACVIGAIITIFLVFRKPLMRYLLHDKWGIATKSELKEGIHTTKSELKEDIDATKSELKADIDATKSELKADIQSLKENDLFHTNKAMLIGFSLLLKKEQQQGFERIKDAILETTPDNKKEDIKAITL